MLLQRSMGAGDMWQREDAKPARTWKDRYPDLGIKSRPHIRPIRLTFPDAWPRCGPLLSRSSPRSRTPSNLLALQLLSYSNTLISGLLIFVLRGALFPSSLANSSQPSAFGSTPREVLLGFGFLSNDYG